MFLFVFIFMSRCVRLRDPIINELICQSTIPSLAMSLDGSVLFMRREGAARSKC
jgi:hypothetical protein